MRVLLIANSYPLVRNEEIVTSTFFLRDFCRELVRQGAQVSVLTPSRTGYVPIVEPGIETETFDWIGQGSASLSSVKVTSLRGLRQVTDLFRRGKHAAQNGAQRLRPDVILAAFALPSGRFAQNASRKIGVPYFVWCLGSDIHTWARRPGLKQLTQSVLKHSAGNFADGFDLAEQVTALSGRPTAFLASSIPMQPVARTPAENGVFRFLYAGRFEPVKGTDVLLRAWELLVKRGYGSRVRLTLCGGGETFAPMVERLRADPIVGPTLEVSGWVQHNELPARYAAADAVVIPSRNESIPVVLSEGVEAGCAIVATRAGDMGTLVDRFELGRSVPVEDVEALLQALIDLVDRGHTFNAAKRSEFLQLMNLAESARAFLKHASLSSGN